MSFRKWQRQRAAHSRIHLICAVLEGYQSHRLHLSLTRHKFTSLRRNFRQESKELFPKQDTQTLRITFPKPKKERNGSISIRTANCPNWNSIENYKHHGWVHFQKLIFFLYNLKLFYISGSFYRILIKVKYVSLFLFLSFCFWNIML